MEEKITVITLSDQLISFIFSLTISYKFTMSQVKWSIKHSITIGQQIFARKENQHIRKAYTQMELWSVLKSPTKTTVLTLNFDQQQQIGTDCENFTLGFKQLGFCTFLFFLQTLGFSFEKCKIYSHLEKGYWAIEQQFSSFSPKPR